ncbi:MAG: Rieske (2Fe-2S) protein [Chitinophagaceae bacterium]|nr:Rieske (2Fe-2S) protein [Chitinophagaceae bacterium]
MDRRKFIKTTCSACVPASLLSSFVLNACTPTQYITGQLDKDGLIVNKDQFKIGDKGSFASFIVVRNENLLFPICIYRFNESDYSAIWLKCAHMGAEVNVVGDTLQCPAHGSEYNNRGVVTNGPAVSNLRTFPVVVRQNDLFIDLRKQS